MENERSEETREILARLRRVEIRARGLSHQIFAGEYHSAFKGRGMAFSEVREYQYGDDVRSIDWNVTARLNKAHIKVFEEERELTVMLVVDASGSTRYGSQALSKRNIMAEIAATLAFSAIQNNDKIGLILYTDTVNRFIPPQKGRKHIMRIIWELLGFHNAQGGTDISTSLRYLTNAITKRCTAFLLSDFEDFTPEGTARFANALTVAAKKHDLVALRVYDPTEYRLPQAGLVHLVDMESGHARWVDASSAAVQAQFQEQVALRAKEFTRVFTRARVDWVNVSTEEDYVAPLLQLFKRRG